MGLTCRFIVGTVESVLGETKGGFSSLRCHTVGSLAYPSTERDCDDE